MRDHTTTTRPQGGLLVLFALVALMALGCSNEIQNQPTPPSSNDDPDMATPTQPDQGGEVDMAPIPTEGFMQGTWEVRDRMTTDPLIRLDLEHPPTESAFTGTYTFLTEPGAEPSAIKNGSWEDHEGGKHNLYIAWVVADTDGNGPPGKPLEHQITDATELDDNTLVGNYFNGIESRRVDIIRVVD